MTRLVARLGDVLLWLTAAAGAVAVTATAVMWLTGTRPVVVQSGSMEPAYPVRSVAFVHDVAPTDLREGDVVAVALPGGQRVLHRVVDLRRVRAGVEVVTKGDANDEADADPVLLPHGAPARRAGAVVPGLGGVAIALRTPAAGFALALLLVGPASLGHRRRPTEPALA